MCLHETHTSRLVRLGSPKLGLLRSAGPLQVLREVRLHDAHRSLAHASRPFSPPAPASAPCRRCSHNTLSSLTDSQSSLRCMTRLHLLHRADLLRHRNSSEGSSSRLQHILQEEVTSPISIQLSFLKYTSTASSLPSLSPSLLFLVTSLHSRKSARYQLVVFLVCVSYTHIQQQSFQTMLTA